MGARDPSDINKPRSRPQKTANNAKRKMKSTNITALAMQQQRRETETEEGGNKRCWRCAEVFATAEALFAHEVVHIEQNKPKPLTKKATATKEPNACSSCPQKFETTEACLAHELQHVMNPKNKKRKRTKVGLKKRPESKEEAEFRQLVIDTLRSAKSNEELLALEQLFQPDAEILKRDYNHVVSDLTRVLNSGSKTFSVHPFGSVVTSVALNSSDMDFFIEAHDDSFNPQSKRQTYNLIARLLRSSRGVFSQVIFISGARVPIIKCVHTKTGFSLDLNMSSHFGVFNSRFFGQLLSSDYSDYRLIPLFLILKIWSRQHEMTRAGRMNNYCLMQLFVFYLQNTEPVFLPPLKELLTDEQVVDGIRFGIDLRKLRPQQNLQKIRELLEGFFKFYVAFDFDTYVISTYTGKAIPKTVFEKDGFDEYNEQLAMFGSAIDNPRVDVNITTEPLFCGTSMVVQDPFVLNFCVSRSVSPNVFVEFQNQISVGYKLSLNAELSATELLIGLFYHDLLNTNTPKPKENGKTPKSEETKRAPTDGGPNPNYVFRIKPLNAELTYIRTYLHKLNPDKVVSANMTRQLWLEKVAEFVEEIATSVYGVECSHVNEKAKFPKTEGQLEARDLLQNEAQLNCKSSLDLWTGRPFVTKNNAAVLVHEQLEQTRKLREERTSTKQYQTSLDARCKFVPVVGANTIDIMFYNLSSAKSGERDLKQFFHVLTERIRPFFLAYFERLIKC